ncbi:MAG: response regulator [Bdellovibrionota bacterium]
MSHTRSHLSEIFIVDDDVDLCEVIVWSLKKQGYSVRAFSSGKSALKTLQHTKPALLIVDFHLGDMKGCEFLEKRWQMSHSCPVIVISGSPDVAKCAIPTDKYMSIVEKPLDLEGLLREIRKLNVPYLLKSSNEASMQLSHGPASAE